LGKANGQVAECCGGFKLDPLGSGMVGSSAGRS
jgi:hypothetical protein